MSSEDELARLRIEIKKLKKQNKELKKALLSSLDARIYSLLNLCGFNNSNRDEEEFGEG